MELELSQYDTAMLFGALLMARKHGDQQTYDWAADFRDRISEKLEGHPTGEQADNK